MGVVYLSGLLLVQGVLIQASGSPIWRVAPPGGSYIYYIPPHQIRYFILLKALPLEFSKLLVIVALLLLLVTYRCMII